MNKSQGLFRRGAELAVFSAMAGILIAGCGGYVTTPKAGTSPSGPTAVGSYIADELGTNFNGSWAPLAAGSTASAVAGADTLTATAAANTYASLFTDMRLVNGTWSAASYVAAQYDLIPAGWLSSPNTGTLTDNGDGADIRVAPAGEPAYVLSITHTSLTGSSILCPASCVAPGVYPAGAAEYIRVAQSDSYHLIAASVSAAAVTDALGVPLPAVPAVGDTFCDPILPATVFQTIGAVPTGANNYNVYNAADCTQANISSALQTAPLGTVLITTKSTGNTVVQQVLLLSNAAGANAPPWLNNAIYGPNLNNVWYGWFTPVGAIFDFVANKITINAELTASGFQAIP